LIIASRVVDLPEPVGPVIRTSPWGRLAKYSMAGGSTSWSREGSFKGMIRRLMAIEPIWK
jgi:hypothetical protein